MMQAFLRRSNGLIRTGHLYNSPLASTIRTISVGSDSAAYAGDGKTTVRLLNNAESNVNFINAYSNTGFRLHNNLFITGSIILFPTHVFSWSVRRARDISLDSLLLFDLIVPKVKIVIIGFGESDEDFDLTITTQLKKKGISCEMLPTHNAVTTYNYLVNDAVHVAGAFIPTRKEFVMTEKDTVEMSTDVATMDGKHFMPQESYLGRDKEMEQKKLYQKTVGRQSKKDKFDD